MDPEKDLEGATPLVEDENSGGEPHDLEAAFSVLAALNLTKRPDGPSASADGSRNTPNGTADSTSITAPASTGYSIPIPYVSQLPSDSSFPPPQAQATSAADSYAAPDTAANRAALQGSLALLAAQLAELAGDADHGSASSVPVPEWPTPAEASAVAASASASSALNMLEGFGLDMFGSSAWAGLRGATVDVKQ